MYQNIKNYMENMTFLQIPQDLLEPRYKGLKPIDLMIYATLLNRTRLSIANEWIDDKGYYVKYEQVELAKYLRVSRNTLKAGLKRLVKFDLLEVVTKGSNKCDSLYLKPCSKTEHSEELNEVEVNAPCSKTEQQNMKPCSEIEHRPCSKTEHDKEISFLEKKTLLKNNRYKPLIECIENTFNVVLNNKDCKDIRFDNITISLVLKIAKNNHIHNKIGYLIACARNNGQEVDVNPYSRTTTIKRQEQVPSWLNQQSTTQKPKQYDATDLQKIERMKELQNQLLYGFTC